MIELPEAVVLSRQIAEHLGGKVVGDVAVLQSPHKFAWFFGDPQDTRRRLRGKKITTAESHGGMVRVRLGRTSLIFSEGPSLRTGADLAAAPKKHQLLLTFRDSSFLSASIRMYGGILCFEDEEWDDEYYLAARDRPSPLGSGFTRRYFRGLCDAAGFDKLSAKAFLATEQRVPGLGNGVLQDILFHAGVHPKRTMGTVTSEELDRLYASVRSTLERMVDGGGRDTEKDLFGESGGYRTILGRKTAGTPCPNCASMIRKATYAGGSIYFCPDCQPLT